MSRQYNNCIIEIDNVQYLQDIDRKRFSLVCLLKIDRAGAWRNDEVLVFYYDDFDSEEVKYALAKNLMLSKIETTAKKILELKAEEMFIRANYVRWMDTTHNPEYPWGQWEAEAESILDDQLSLLSDLDDLLYEANTVLRKLVTHQRQLERVIGEDIDMERRWGFLDLEPKEHSA